MIQQLGQAGTRSPTESVSQPNPHRRNPIVGVRIVCSADRRYTLAACRIAAPRRAFFWPTFVARILSPRSQKFGYGLLLRGRSSLDSGRENKKLFLAMLKQKTGKSSFDGRARYRNRSGVVELVRKDRLLLARYSRLE